MGADKEILKIESISGIYFSEMAEIFLNYENICRDQSICRTMQDNFKYIFGSLCRLDVI